MRPNFLQNGDFSKFAVLRSLRRQGDFSGKTENWGTYDDALERCCGAQDAPSNVAQRMVDRFQGWGSQSYPFDPAGFSQETRHLL